MDIGRLKRNPGECESFDFRFSPEVGGEACELLSPMHVAGTFSFTGNDMRLAGSLGATARQLCSRCLTNVDQEFFFDFEETFDVEEFPGEEADLDLEDIAGQIWISSLPMRTLCSEDCKGLCPSCGKDLNAGDCSCPVQDADPRMEKLKNLLQSGL